MTAIANMESAMQRSTVGNFFLRTSLISDAWPTIEGIKGTKSSATLPMIQLTLRKLKIDWVAMTNIKFTQYLSVKKGKQSKNGMMKR